MDNETVKKVQSIDFEMGHLCVYINRLEKGKSVYHIAEKLQNELGKM